MTQGNILWFIAQSIFIIKLVETVMNGIVGIFKTIVKGKEYKVVSQTNSDGTGTQGIKTAKPTKEGKYCHLNDEKPYTIPPLGLTRNDFFL